MPTAKCSHGDPDFVECRWRTLLSDAYNAERRSSSPTRVRSTAPGARSQFRPRWLKLRRECGPSRPAPAAHRRPARRRRTDRRPDGQHAAGRQPCILILLIRRQHDFVNAVGGWLQSFAGDPELGFASAAARRCSTSRKTIRPRSAPARRPRTTLSPTMALRDGEPYLAWGSPGGDGQDQWIAQFFLRHVHAGMNMQESIDAPAWHSRAFPELVLAAHGASGLLVVEGRVPKKDRRRAQSGAATRSRSVPTGRKAG